MKIIQLEFDFGFEAQTKSNIVKAEKPKKQKQKPKPTTAEDFKPGTDNHKIKLCEKRFRDGDKNALVSMYHVIYNLADKYIRSESKEKRFFVKREDVEEKCNDIGLYIIQRYLEDSHFQLQTPSAYVWLRVMRALYYQDWTEKHVTFTNKL